MSDERLTAMRQYLDSVRPTIPFDLEPDVLSEPHFCIAENARRAELLDRYARVREWHRLDEQLKKLERKTP